MFSKDVNGSSVPNSGHKTATSTNADTNTLDGTRRVTHHDLATLVLGCGKFVCTVPLDKQNIFTLQTAPGYNEFTKYCATVGYEPYLNNDKTDCIPDNLDVLSRFAVTHITTPYPLHPSMPLEGYTPPSERGIQDSEGYTYGIHSPAL